jgi:DNA modification methylase
MMNTHVARTELVWPGKYDDHGHRVEPPRIMLPFQLLEVARERADASGWRNKLIWGDNLHVLGSLLKEFTGKVDLIYIDPPFDTGADFSYKVLVGDGEEPLPGEVAYRDAWGRGPDSYLHMLYQRLLLLRDLLAETGSIFIHLDVHTGPYVKLLMDEVFGRDNFQNEIAWYYYNKMHDSRKRVLPKAFDQILYYVKSRSAGYTYHRLEERRDEPVRQLKRVKVDGRMVNARDEAGNVIYQERDSRVVDNVWRLRCLQPANKAEWVHFETQKPVDLIERVLAIASNPGDLVLDCFAGSGTTLVAAERMGRRWIGCELGRFAIHTARKRLLDLRIEDQETGEVRVASPFEILDLGRHERRSWQGMEPARLEVSARAAGGGPEASRSVKVILQDFIIPSTERIPPEVQRRIQKWADYIDYWAVDWDFRGDTFVNRWQAYRTRQRRALPLETPAHIYERPGRYDILVKVVDIFGNDTSHLVRWEAE